VTPVLLGLLRRRRLSLQAILSVILRESRMRNEFTAIIEKDGEWYIAYCPEVSGANGQGRTKQEARESLSEAIALILQDRRDDALRGVPPDAERETVTVE
jgi:predicted RNase H-like HicB family nuclease